MIRRSLNIVGLGEGLRGKKAVDLALKHPKHIFVGVDSHPLSEYGRYLKSRGVKEKPRNLTIKNSTGAFEYLASQKEASVDHAYAHFLFQHVSYAERQKIYSQLMRTMRPGTRFVTIEEANYITQLPLELRNTGFIVSVKRIGAEELLKLDTDNGEMNAKHHLTVQKNRRALQSLFQNAAPSTLAQLKLMGMATSLEGTMKFDMETFRRTIGEKWAMIEGRTPSKDARRAVERILRDVNHVYTDTPWVVITARKPMLKKE
ncbi:Uncharacterised protein [uncultured archaeon]|nr:Uncharacterised protein [uncultured archaeon]